MTVGRVLIVFMCGVLAASGNLKGAETGRRTGGEATYVIRSPTLSENEVIAGFEVDIKNGAITAVSGVPVGWTINIVNEPEWGNDPDYKTKIGAGMIMGTLSAEELHDIRFHVIKGGIDGVPFVISGTLSTNFNPNLVKEESVPLTADNFEIVK